MTSFAFAVASAVAFHLAIVQPESDAFLVGAILCAAALLSLIFDIIHRGVSTYQAYQCDSCGGHSRSRFTLNSKEKRSNLLTCI